MQFYLRDQCRNYCGAWGWDIRIGLRFLWGKHRNYLTGASFGTGSCSPSYLSVDTALAQLGRHRPPDKDSTWLPSAWCQVTGNPLSLMTTINHNAKQDPARHHSGIHLLLYWRVEVPLLWLFGQYARKYRMHRMWPSISLIRTGLKANPGHSAW